MTKTAKQIVGDIINLISGSELERAISGEVYRSGFRPKGSMSEDLIVHFTTGSPDQIQEGVVTLNIYIPDIQQCKSYVQSGQRCEEIEVIAQSWVASLNKGGSEYNLTLQQTIYTECEQEIKQHFIVVKLRYELLTD